MWEIARMGRIRAALLPPNNGMLGLPPLLPEAVASQARAAAAIFGLLALAWLLADLPLLWAFAAVAVGGAGLLLLRLPWLVWPGLAIALPFASGVEIGPLSMADGLLAAAVFLWFVDGVRKNRLRLTMGFLPGLFVLYLLALLLSFPNAINLQKAIEGVIKWAQMLVAILLIQEALSPRQARWLIWGLLAGGALQAAIGVHQFVFRVGPPNFLLLDRFMRAAGTFGQPNPFAGYLGLTLPVAVALFLHFVSSIVRPAGAAEPTGHPNRATSGRLTWGGALTGAAAYGCVAGIIGLGVLASWSRGGWLGAAASVSVVLLIHGGRMVASAAFGAVFALTLAGGALLRFIPSSLTDRMADLPTYLGLGMWEVVQQPITDRNFSVIERLAHWIAALRMWELSPWLGIGPGNYAAVYPQVRLPRWEEPLGHAHNIYLNVLAENGLIGLFAYLVMWGGVVGWLLYQRRRMQICTHVLHGPSTAALSDASTWNAALILGVLGVVVHLSVHHLFDYLYVQGMYLHIALWLGAAVALARKGTSRERGEPAFAMSTGTGH